VIRYVALALALGGWVCQRDGENPCLGATTCATDVGDACCPLDTYFYCGACRNTAEECASELYACTDESALLDCSFDADVPTPTCTVDGDGWRVQATGTLRGCGGETVLFSINGIRVPDGVACGAWATGEFGGCTPNTDPITETQFTVDAHVDTNAPTSIELVRGHGSAPLIATIPVRCP